MRRPSSPRNLDGFYPMAKKKTAPSVSAPLIAAMTYSEASSLSQEERVARFKFEADASQRAFAALGKLYRLIDKNLPKGKFINSTLAAVGVKPGTISNASYGARVYDLVEAGTLTEAEFDQLTFNEVSLVARVITAKSKKQLTPEQVATLLRTAPDTFEADIRAYYEDGMTASEKAEIEAKVKADKEKAEAEAKAKAEAQAKELEEIKKRNEELKAANAEMVAQAAAAQSDAPAAPATPAPAAATDAPADAAPAPSAAAPAAAVEADPAATADELIALLDEIEHSLALLSDEDQGRVGARLCALAAAFVESGKSVAA